MGRLATALGLAASFAAFAAPANAADGVVAVLDSGINPYHAVFRDTSPRAQRPPFTYLAGYPRDAIELRLHLDGPGTYADRVKEDCKTWDAVKPGQLYWIPGTKIIGAISFQPPETSDCAANPPSLPHIVDNDGHGTMTASRATAATRWGACPECLVVSVQGTPSIPLVGAPSADAELDGMRWLSANSGWIDAESNSWGPFVSAWEPSGTYDPMFGSPEIARAAEQGGKRHLAFWASGNGALGRAGVAGHPTTLQTQLAPSTVAVGGVDSGHVIAWSGFPPQVVSDACWSWAAKAKTLTDADDHVGGGTSGATPFAAGIAVAFAREARSILGDRRTGVRGEIVARGPAGRVSGGPLADGRFTLAEWKSLVLATATSRPAAQYEDGPVCDGVVEVAPDGSISPSIAYAATPVRWVDVGPSFPEYHLIGYGAVDRPAQQLALSVLRGTKGLPDRSATDAYFADERGQREAVHDMATLGTADPDLPAAADDDLPEDKPRPAKKAKKPKKAAAKKCSTSRGKKTKAKQAAKKKRSAKKCRKRSRKRR